jgi:hypothetical protein
MCLVSRLMVGFGTCDTLTCTALLFCTRDTLSLAVALVCDLVFCAGAVCGTLIGVDTIFSLHFTSFLGWISNCAFVGCTLGTDVCTLGVGVCIVRALLVMGLVVCIFDDAADVSTLKTGCILVS